MVRLLKSTRFICKHRYSTKQIYNLDQFIPRHNNARVDVMLKELHIDSLESLVDKIVPNKVRSNEYDDGSKQFSINHEGKGETETLQELKEIMKKNKSLKSLLGQGYYNTITPNVILRNLMQNPSWLTSYTPYQPEISQGRLESLLNFQTMVTEITGMEISNASLLDESSAAAEAMTMCINVNRGNRNIFLVSKDCHPTTIDLIKTRADPLGVEIIVSDHREFKFTDQVAGCILQYPDTNGNVTDFQDVVEAAHNVNALTVFATDLLACTLLTPPGELGADIVVGTNQRFGVPLGYGGPHAGIIATRAQYQRLLPGRIIGVSRDLSGNMALRMALQTREQHIRRERATSNICTAQALLANVSAMYAVYHGPEGLKKIAKAVHLKASAIADAASKAGHILENQFYFDTLRIRLTGLSSDEFMRKAMKAGFNVRKFNNETIGISTDETLTQSDIQTICSVFGTTDPKYTDHIQESSFSRSSPFLTHETFNRYHSEHELLRYMYRLEKKDIALNTSMIPLGSCTMKLNATSELIPISWPEVNGIHPFTPLDQVEGYLQMIGDVERWLCELTGFDAMSLQPNSGAQGEYSGLRAIKAYHDAKGESHRDVCLIPISAHGTNPASASMCRMKVVIVKCDKKTGNINLEHLREVAEKYADRIAAAMITYPSTYGVYEEGIVEACKIVHEFGGLVYMDGANMNAQVGITNPRFMGADVCHLNLHKTFAIPHGGGGPGVGAQGVTSALKPFLPSNPVIPVGGELSIGSISQAPFGSSSILPITWMYLRMMGLNGLKQASQTAMLNANYLMSHLSEYYPIYYQGQNGMCAHEFILDVRQFKKTAGIEAEDIAKRLQDYGFHAPTMSFPIANTLMIEPTESETKEELDRFIDAFVRIRQEIRDVEDGKQPQDNNVLTNAPHTATDLLAENWDRPYSREQAAFPAEWVRKSKYWPPVNRLDQAFGDRNLICSCPPTDSYEL